MRHIRYVFSLLVLVGILFAVSEHNFAQFRLERQARVAFLHLRDLLDLKNSTAKNLSELVDAARVGRGIFVYSPLAKNPFPEFLPEAAYDIFPVRDEAPEGLLMKVAVSYWFAEDVDVSLFWDGKISGFSN
jgi:hypothetical protein